MRYKVAASLMLSVSLLAACSGEDGNDKEKVDYASFDDAAVSRLVDEGNYAKAIEIIKGQEDLGVADQTDYLTLMRIFLEQQNGIAAEVAIERAIGKGADKASLALPRARALFMQGRAREARQVLEDGYSDDTSVGEVALLLGDIANNDGKRDEARAQYLKATEALDSDYRGHLALALLELGSNNLDAAASAADAAGALAPDNGLVAYAQGMVARYRGQAEAALVFLNKAVEVQPSNLLAHLELASINIDLGSNEDAQKELDIIYGMAPEHPMAHYYTALLQAQKGELQKAEALLLRTGDLTKTFPPAVRTYGLVAYQLQKYSTAEPYLERYLAQVPADRLVRLALAECLTNRSKAREAMQVLTPLLGKDSQDQDAFIQAAAASAAAGDLQASRGYFEKAEGLQAPDGPDTPARRRLLAAKLALADYVQGDAEGAKAKLTAMYADADAGKDLPDREGLLILGNMQLETGDLDAAVKTAERLLAADEKSVVGLNLLGAARYRQRQYDAAVDAYSKALAINPDYQSALKNRALAYLQAEKYTEARSDLEQLVKAAPGDPQVRGMLGWAYLSLDRPKDALPHLKQAQAALPTSVTITTDYAEALAGSGLVSAAIEQAKAAKKLAGGREEILKYLDGLLETWEKQEAERAEADRLLKEKAREELARQREEREKKLKDAEAAAAADAVKDKGEPGEDKPQGRQ